MIELGSKVRDTVTGFVGVAICRCEYLNGCTQYGIKPPADKDNKLRGAEYIDEGQLIIIAHPEEVKQDAAPKKRIRRSTGLSLGGPSSDAPGETSDQPDADDYYGSDPDDNWATR